MSDEKRLETDAPAPAGEEKPRSRFERLSDDDLLEIDRHTAYLKRRRFVQIAACLVLVAGAWFIAQFSTRGTIIKEISKGSRDEVVRLATQNPSDTQVQLAAAWRLLGEGYAGEAQQVMERVVTRESGSADCWHGLGRAAAANGDAIRATEAYRKATELDPKSVDSRVLLAQVYYEAGLYSDALAVYEEINALRPTELRKTDYYAECLFIKGRPDEGIDHAKKVLEELPLMDAMFARLNEAAIATGRIAEVEKLCRRRLQISSLYYYGEVRNALVRLILAREHTPEELIEAEAQARKATGDGHPRFDAGLALVLIKQGRLKEAREAAEAGLARDKTHRECLEILADVTARLGDRAASNLAKQRLAQALKPENDLKPLRDRARTATGDRAAHTELAAALDRAGKPAEAAEAIFALTNGGAGQDAGDLLEQYRLRALKKLAARTKPSADRISYAP